MECVCVSVACLVGLMFGGAVAENIMLIFRTFSCSREPLHYCPALSFER